MRRPTIAIVVSVVLLIVVGLVAILPLRNWMVGTVQTSNSRSDQNLEATPLSALGPDTIEPGGGFYFSTYFSATTQAEITWNSTGPIDVYLFSQSQYVQYENNRMTTPNVVSRLGSESGGIVFCPPETGEYVLVVLNAQVKLIGVDPTFIVASASTFQLSHSACAQAG